MIVDAAVTGRTKRHQVVLVVGASLATAQTMVDEHGTSAPASFTDAVRPLFDALAGLGVHSRQSNPHSVLQTRHRSPGEWSLSAWPHPNRFNPGFGWQITWKLGGGWGPHTWQ
jgi:hypothetical protein